MKSNGISLQFQCVTLSITTLIILFFLIGELRTFCSIDTSPTIYPLDPQTIAKYHGEAHPVESGLTITDFPQFNMTENKFTFSGFLWFRFDPKEVPLETIEKFSFWRGEIESKSEPLLEKKDGKMLAVYKVRVTFKTNLYYGYFPFEDHKIFIMLMNDKVDPGKFQFSASHSDLIIAPSVYVSGWNYFAHEVKAGYNTTEVGAPEQRTVISHPTLLFQIDFLHQSARYIISIVLPLFIIFFIDLCSFCLDQRADHAVLVQISTGNIVALVAYRFVIENLSPRSGYPMIADFLFFLFLMNTLAVFIINNIGPYLSIRQKKMVSIGLQSLVLGACTYVFTVWISC